MREVSKEVEIAVKVQRAILKVIKEYEEKEDYHTILNASLNLVRMPEKPADYPASVIF